MWVVEMFFEMGISVLAEMIIKSFTEKQNWRLF